MRRPSRRAASVALGVVVVLAVVISVVVARRPWERVAISWVLRSVPRDADVASALTPSDRPGRDVVLLVGNDDRAAHPESPQPVPSGHRADVVILLALDAERREIRAMSLPRDLTVDTAEFGPLLLTEAFAYGGPALLTEAVTDLTGLPVQHYVEVSFAAFERVVDELGGVDLTFCAPSRDIRTGLSVPGDAVHLDGESALALVRSRSYERLVDGVWVDGGAGDAERVQRQLAVLRSAVGNARDRADIWSLLDLGRSTGSLLVLDPHFGTDTVQDVMRLVGSGSFSARALAAVPVRSQTERLSPFGGDHIGGRLRLEPAIDAPATFDWFLGDNAPAAPVQPAPTSGTDAAAECV